LGWCISSSGFLTLPNNLFFTQIIKQSINYVFSSIIHDCLPTFGQVFDFTLEEIRRFGREEVVEPILELSVVVEGNSAQVVGERMNIRLRTVCSLSAWIKAFRRSSSKLDGRPEHGVSHMSKLPFLGCSFSNRVFSVDGTNVSSGLCSFGTSSELVKKKVSEMLIFLNLTL
jgi:hypothetical protein